MLRVHTLILVLASVVWVAAPRDAHAQYKNSAFGLDVGYFFITKPPLTDQAGTPLDDTHRPIRLSNGIRLGGEGDFKMRDDHWWFSARLNAAFLTYGSGNGSGTQYEQNFDQQASDALGTIVGLEGVAGLRYVVFTDRIRPYLQIGVSYMHLFSFTGTSGNTCVVPDYCDGTETYGDAFLPHTNVFALHAEPGLEWIISRDVAIHILFDYQRWVIINADDNNALTVGLGMTFFG